MYSHSLPTFKMVLTCVTENNFRPISGLCDSLHLLATDHMDKVCIKCSHSGQGQSHMHTI